MEEDKVLIGIDMGCVAVGLVSLDANNVAEGVVGGISSEVVAVEEMDVLRNAVPVLKAPDSFDVVVEGEPAVAVAESELMELAAAGMEV